MRRVSAALSMSRATHNGGTVSMEAALSRFTGGALGSCCMCPMSTDCGIVSENNGEILPGGPLDDGIGGREEKCGAPGFMVAPIDLTSWNLRLALASHSALALVCRC